MEDIMAYSMRKLEEWANEDIQYNDSLRKAHYLAEDVSAALNKLEMLVTKSLTGYRCYCSIQSKIDEARRAVDTLVEVIL